MQIVRSYTSTTSGFRQRSSRKRRRGPVCPRGLQSVIGNTPEDDGELESPLPDNLIKVTVRKPLGVVLGETTTAGGKTEKIFIEEVTDGGNGAKAGIKAGDTVIRCSATILKKDSAAGEYEKEGYGATPYTNWKRIMLDTRGKDFDTVMAALGSNNERWGIFDVVMELQRDE